MSPQRERFVLEFLKDGNARAAAARAGYRHPKQMGSRLTKQPEVRKALEKAAAPALRAAQVTLEGHLEELARLRELAIKNGQFGPAVKAEESRGRVMGLYVERSVVETRQLPQVIIE